MSLTGKTPADTYKDIIYVDNNNSGVDSTVRAVKTGSGSSTSIKTSDRSTIITSSTDNTGAFFVQNSAEDIKFRVDTTNNQVKALGTHINTQYAYFGVTSGLTTTYTTNTHYPLPFAGNNQSAGLTDNFTLGTGTDPATSFTTADGATTDASLIVGTLWYVPDNISIDGVHSLEGCDNATGGTTNMHLMSYTFNSGSTSALTSGTLLAHNNDVTNAGSEQAYLSTWTVDSAAVVSGKVILATFESSDATGDYSASVTVKYHLT
tara:strand:+ start:732 stop:1520 length:789 start_codon:yes stop_codon:yes gene_type:complete